MWIDLSIEHGNVPTTQSRPRSALRTESGHRSAPRCAVRQRAGRASRTHDRWPSSASQSRAAELDQCIEHRLQVEGRAADDLEHVGGGGLLLQRFAQLVEQAGVLDGDDGLAGEVL